MTAVASPPVAQVGASKWTIAIAVALGALLEIIDTSIVNVALTDMQATLGATITQMSWVVSSYAIANVIILPLSAWLGTRFGKKNYFVFSLIGFTASSVLCGVSTSLAMLTVARILQGLCGGGLLAKAQAILFETFPKEEQAAAQGFFGAIVIAGPVIGPTLGGFIVTNIGWRWIFFINLPVGIAAIAMCLSALPADTARKATGPVDWLAIALLAVGIGSFQTFLEEGNTEDWFQSTFIDVMAVMAVVGLVLFVWRVLGAKDPVVDLRILRYRSLAAGSVLSIVVGMALYGAIFALPLFTQTVLGFTAQETGLVMLPGALVSAFAMPLAAKSLKLGDPRVLLVGGALVLAGGVYWLGHLSTQTGVDDLFWPLILRSFGSIFMFLPLNMASLGPIPKKDIAAASAFYNLTRQLGGSIGVAVLSTLLASRVQFHRTTLANHLGVTSPVLQARLATYTGAFVAKGADPVTAKQRALYLLDGATKLQASVMSFNDCFVLVAIAIVVSLPLVLLLGKPPKDAAPIDAH